MNEMKEALRQLLIAIRDWQTGPDFARPERESRVKECWLSYQSAAINEGIRQFTGDESDDAP